MVDINAAFPSSYIKASDLQNREVRVTISHVNMEDVGDDHKPVCYFVGKERGLVLNKTNANTIMSVTGQSDTDMWVNQQIVIFPTQTDFGGKQVACIRVKLTSTPAAPVTQAPAQVANVYSSYFGSQDMPFSSPPPSDAQVQDLNNQVMGGGSLDDEIPFGRIDI